MKPDLCTVSWQTNAAQLLRVRYAVFVDEQGVPAELEQDAEDAGALHLLARSPDGEPIATARLLADGHIGRMAVLPAWRGQGLGTAMLQRLIEIGRQRGQARLFLHAQCHAEGFYRRCGFIAEGPVFDDAGIDHRLMVLYLKQSPAGPCVV